MTPIAQRNLSGWGNFPIESCNTSTPQTLDALRDIVTGAASSSCIARGLGRAYGDSALNRNASVILQTSLNCFISFDPQTGILHAEAGVSFADIIEHFLPRGWFLPTTPGTKYVTLGGAIAADVHGKNHHVDGSFGNFVLDFQIMLASGEVMNCSPSQNTDLFDATLGGMGLTGILLSARIQLVRVPSAYCDVTFHRTQSLDETLAHFAAHDDKHRYSVAWIDCLALGSSLGRSVVMLGDDAQPQALPSHLHYSPHLLPPKKKKNVPFQFPAIAMNALSVKAFNTLYYAANKDGRRIVDFDSYFYPLDGILHWNRIYGRRGFIQYQALFPPQTAAQGLRELLERTTASKKASFLAVLKRSGQAGRGMLSYLYPGYTLAMDFANTGEDLLRLAADLDEILLKHGGRLYLAKDATTTPRVFAAMYPRLAEFQRIKQRYDPQSRFSSSQARRLGIVQ